MGTDVRGPLWGQDKMCEPILRAMPEWFGIEEATAAYVDEVKNLPTFLAVEGHEVVGFLSVSQPFERAAEIHVMGVHPDKHRRGIGRTLVEATEKYLRQQGVTFLQVKTLSPGRPNEHYERTRAFYAAVGFQPLEEHPELWGPDNPCLQLIKYLSE